MGENETTDVKPAATTTAPAAAKKEKKKDKKPVVKAETMPHVAGRILHIEVSASGVEFAVRGKKNKPEVFSLKGMDASAATAAAALISGLLASKTKLRVDYTTSGDARLINKISAHH